MDDSSSSPRRDGLQRRGRLEAYRARLSTRGLQERQAREDEARHVRFRAQAASRASARERHISTDLSLSAVTVRSRLALARGTGHAADALSPRTLGPPLSATRSQETGLAVYCDYDEVEVSQTHATLGQTCRQDTFATHHARSAKHGCTMHSVFDGHGGAATAQHCATGLLSAVETHALFGTSPACALRYAFGRMHEQCAEQEGGTTATVVLLREDLYIVANVGDSRCVLVKKDGRTVQLSCDHRVGNFKEEDRITSEGGSITEVRVGAEKPKLLVNGYSSVTRSVGDHSMGPILTAMPDILQRTFGEDDAFLLLATAGVWDFLSNNSVGQVMAESRDTADGAQHIIKMAREKGCKSAMTLMAIRLQPKTRLTPCTVSMPMPEPEPGPDMSDLSGRDRARASPVPTCMKASFKVVASPRSNTPVIVPRRLPHESEVVTVQGTDPTREDCFAQHRGFGFSIFGVFDGHGGRRSAQYCAEHMCATIQSHPEFAWSPMTALAAAYQQIDEECCLVDTHMDCAYRDGTTANVVVLYERSCLVANVGDSRALLVRHDGSVEQLSIDHRVGNFQEEDRIEALGGEIVNIHKKGEKSCLLVNGETRVTRSIGDGHMKPLLTATPELTETVLGYRDEYVVLGTDGIWDYVSNAEVAEVLLKMGATDGVQKLLHMVKERGCADNATLIAIHLRQPGRGPSTSSRSTSDPIPDWAPRESYDGMKLATYTFAQLNGMDISELRLIAGATGVSRAAVARAMRNVLPRRALISCIRNLQARLSQPLRRIESLYREQSCTLEQRDQFTKG